MKILLVLLFSFNTPLFAEDIFEVAEKYNLKKKAVNSLEIKKRKILSDVYALEKKTKKIVEEKSILEFEKVRLKQSLKKTSKEIVNIERDLKNLTPQLQKRLSYVHKIQDLPWMYAFLSSYNIAELDRMVKTFENINKQEAQVTVAYFKNLDSLKKKKEKLHTVARNMLKVKKTISKKEVKIQEQHYVKKRLLKNLEQFIKRNKKELAKIKIKGKALTKKSEFENLEILFSTTFLDKKGELPHPIKAPIKHYYGLNEALLKDNIELLHKGLFYKAKENRSVKAVEVGRVKYAQSTPGLGGVIIIDHGNHYYSIYSNLKKIKVKVNNIVKSQQNIATVGTSSLQFKEGLYFEIRHFSEPENPEKWLKKKNNQLAGL